MANGETILQMMDDLETMPGLKLERKLRELEFSLFTLDGNYRDFQQVVEGISSHSRAHELLYVRNRDQLSEYLMHIGRLLHNFVAAVQSLVDHTNNLYDKLNVGPNKLGIEPKPFPAYKERIAAEFAEDPLYQFVKYLRHYCQHYQLPAVGLRFSFAPSTGSETKMIHLSKTGLLGYDKWSAGAKKFLSEQAEEINILEVVTSYRSKVIAFYDWFLRSEREIFSDEIDPFMAKQAEMARLRVETEINARMNHPNPFKKEDVFLNLFNSHDFDALEKTQPDSPERAAKAISLIERYFPISDELKDKIRTLFGGPSPIG
jgi:hypothetical protein